MQIAIYTRGSEYLSDEELSEWLNVTENCDVNAIFNSRFAQIAYERGFGHIRSYSDVDEIPEDTELVISYGGDGTFLQCVRMLRGRDIPVMGINSGRLGFLANVPRVAVKDVIKNICSKNYIVEERSVIVAEGLGFALNEFSIQKEGVNMINICLSIDGEDVVEYKADGLLISTPTGSTAYSMSVGGPIVAPSCDCIVIIPIAPHNLTMRPLVVEGSAVIEVCAESRMNNLVVTLDNTCFPAENGQTFRLHREKNRIKIAQMPDNSFYKTIRNKLMWGLDGRGK